MFIKLKLALVASESFSGAELCTKSNFITIIYKWTASSVFFRLYPDFIISITALFCMLFGTLSIDFLDISLEDQLYRRLIV